MGICVVSWEQIGLVGQMGRTPLLRVGWIPTVPPEEVTDELAANLKELGDSPLGKKLVVVDVEFSLQPLHAGLATSVLTGFLVGKCGFEAVAFRCLNEFVVTWSSCAMFHVGDVLRRK